MQKVVVVGAGVGGLSAGALLAKHGFDVTVLEAHVYPGGSAGTFYHQGYRFDAGATLAGGFQPGGPHDLIGCELNIEWPVKRAEPAWVVQLPDRCIVRWGLDEQWREERLNKLPALRYFWRQQEAVADAVWKFSAQKPPFPPANWQDILRIASRLPIEMIPAAPLAFSSVARWLDWNLIKDRTSRLFVDAQLIISAQTNAQFANAMYGAVAMDLPRAGAYHVKGGIGSIAKTLAETLKKQGGDVFYRQQVTKIIPRTNGRYLLVTNKQLEMEADIVIANLTPWGLADILGDHSPDSLREELSQREEPWGAFTVYAGVDADTVQGMSDHYQVVMDSSKSLGEGNSVFISLSDAEDDSRAPAGQRTLTMSSHTCLNTWWRLAEFPEAYEARKEVYQEEFLKAAETVLPNIRKGIRFITTGTPLTFQRFTRRPRGMVGGFPMTSLFTVRGPQTGLPNLWLVGDSIFPGQSTAGVTAGAMRVVDEVKRVASVSRRTVIPIIRKNLLNTDLP